MGRCALKREEIKKDVNSGTRKQGSDLEKDALEDGEGKSQNRTEALQQAFSTLGPGWSSGTQALAENVHREKRTRYRSLRITVSGGWLRGQLICKRC